MASIEAAEQLEGLWLEARRCRRELTDLCKILANNERGQSAQALPGKMKSECDYVLLIHGNYNTLENESDGSGVRGCG